MDSMYDRDMRDQWENSLLGVRFWEDATKHVEQLTAGERKALPPHLSPVQSPAQSPAKDPVQTTVTSASGKSPTKRKSLFPLSRLASFNNLRFLHSSAGTDTTNSPEKSPTKSLKSSKKGSWRLPSFKSLSLRHRGPIVASTEGFVELRKPTPTRPSILSPTTFFPPEYSLPPLPPAPRPIFRSLYRGPSATNIDIAPPTASEDSYPCDPVAPNHLSILSFQDWLEQQSDPQPETMAPPHPDTSSFVHLMAHLNDGGTWDDIPRTKLVLELNMLFDVRKVSPESIVDLDDDQILDEGAMTDEVTMVDKGTMTDFDVECPVKTTTMIDNATMTEPDIKGSAIDSLPADKATQSDDILTGVATAGDNAPTLKSAARPVTTEQAGVNTDCAIENQTTDGNLAIDSSMTMFDFESSEAESPTNNKNAKGKAAVHDWDLYNANEFGMQDLPICDAPRYPDQEVIEVAAPKEDETISSIINEALKDNTIDDDRFFENLKDKIKVSVLTMDQVRPLTEFRNLRVLKLFGMMKSYQPAIWKTVWLNPHLTTLELHMAVGLEIVEPVGPSGWEPIKKGWVMNVKSHASPVYYGQGDGEVSPKVGYGEYLDKYCIEKAKVLALATGFPVPTYLPVEHLTLSGFAVDGDPFGMWFRNLKEVHFKKDCIDCGFWLPRFQRNVRVRQAGEFGVARGEDGPSGENSVEELSDEELAELSSAVRGLGVF
ncbi:hypothetical protein CBS147317_9236 [Penicillium roqueforti]|nr:hypothetical protein CBS147372_8562 [Penicillium roqueforti]KAI3146455.1 hypothetical protein CBS147317_9236 [Penicillium roqueforti]